MKIDALIRYIRNFPSEQEFDPMTFISLATWCKGIEEFDVECYVSRVGIKDRKALKTLSEAILSFILFIRTSWEEIASRVEYDPQLADDESICSDGILDEIASWEERYKVFQEYSEKGILLQEPFCYSFSDNHSISTSDPKEAASVVEMIIDDFRFQISYLQYINEHTLPLLAPGETKHISEQFNTLAKTAKAAIEEFLKESPIRPGDIDFSPIIPELTILINKYKVFQKKGKDGIPDLSCEDMAEILALKNIETYEIQSRKKTFVQAMIEGVADILRSEQVFKPNAYGAYDWREEAIRAFGLQENDKHHGFKEGNNPRLVDEFYKGIMDINVIHGY